MFAVDGFHVTAVTAGDEMIVLEVETTATVVGCPRCRVLAEGHGRRVHQVADAPAFGVPVQVRWRKRLWRCRQASCSMRTFSETHAFASARSRLSTRATAWAVGMLQMDDTTVAALARRLGVGWRTLWRAVAGHAAEHVCDRLFTGRLSWVFRPR